MGFHVVNAHLAIGSSFPFIKQWLAKKPDEPAAGGAVQRCGWPGRQASSIEDGRAPRACKSRRQWAVGLANTDLETKTKTWSDLKWDAGCGEVCTDTRLSEAGAVTAIADNSPVATPQSSTEPLQLPIRLHLFSECWPARRSASSTVPSIAWLQRLLTRKSLAEIHFFRLAGNCKGRSMHPWPNRFRFCELGHLDLKTDCKKTPKRAAPLMRANRRFRTKATTQSVLLSTVFKYTAPQLSANDGIGRDLSLD